MCGRDVVLVWYTTKIDITLFIHGSCPTYMYGHVMKTYRYVCPVVTLCTSTISTKRLGVRPELSWPTRRHVGGPRFVHWTGEDGKRVHWSMK